MAEHWNGGTGGKGSRPRPYSVSKEEFDNRFEAIFGKKKKQETLPEYELNKSTGEVQQVIDDIPVLENEEMWAQRVIDEDNKNAGKS
jgi:hypothetical protein